EREAEPRKGRARGAGERDGEHGERDARNADRAGDLQGGSDAAGSVKAAAVHAPARGERRKPGLSVLREPVARGGECRWGCGDPRDGTGSAFNEPLERHGGPVADTKRDRDDPEHGGGDDRPDKPNPSSPRACEAPARKLDDSARAAAPS